MKIENRSNRSTRPALLDDQRVGGPIWLPEAIRAMQNGFRGGVEDVFATAAPDLDLSVVTYHSAADLRPFLESLLAQTFPLTRLRLLVMQHAADPDETRVLSDFVARHGAKFRAISVSSGTNRGYGAGHNRNLRRSTASLFLISNADVILQPDTIGGLAYGLMEAGPEVALVEARQQPMEHPKFYDPTTFETIWCSGCCVLARSAALRAVGGFDQSFFMYGEDVDLSLRLRAAGYRLAYCPWAKIWHAPDPSTRANLRFRGALESGLLLSVKFGTKQQITDAWSRAKEAALHAETPGLRRAARLALVTFAKTAPRTYRARRRLPKYPRNLFNGQDYEWRRYFDLEAADLLSLRPEWLSDRQNTVAATVSIVMRAGSGNEALLERALRSALFQTQRGVEIVVVENGSAQLAPLVERYRSIGFAIRWVAVAALDRARATNLGISCATGDYICFLDEHDILFADHIETLLSRFGREPNAALVTSWSAQGGDLEGGDKEAEDGFELSNIHRQENPDESWRHFARLPTGAALMRRRDLLRAGRVDRRPEFQEDGHLFSRLADAGPVAVSRWTTLLVAPPRAAAEQEQRPEPAQIETTPHRNAERAAMADLILVYHRIGDHDFDPQLLFVNRDRFSGHLAVIADRARLLANGARVQIQFDDGYADTYEPALAAAGIAGVEVTCFLPTEFVALERSFLWDALRVGLHPESGSGELKAAVAEMLDARDAPPAALYELASERCRAEPGFAAELESMTERLNIASSAADRPLTTAQIATMKAAGVRFGLHGHTHRSFAHLSPDDWELEIDGPYRWLTGAAGGPPEAFAFPYGSHRDWNADAVAHLVALGITEIYSAIPERAQLAGQELIPRWAVGNLDDVNFAQQLDEMIGAVLNPGGDLAALAGLMVRAPIDVIAGTPARR